jgi:hypothetical protein
MRALRSIVIASAIASVTFGPASAKNCFDDSIRDVSQSGEVLVMLSGGVYEVLPGDEIDSALWLATDDVLICETSVPYKGKVYTIFEIINTDEQGEKVSARRLK